MKKYIIALIFITLFASVAFGITKYYCPICGSEDIEITSKDDPQYVVNKESMNNLSKADTNLTSSGDLVCHIYIYHYKAICKKCGHIVEYSRCMGCGCNAIPFSNWNLESGRAK